MILPLFSPEAKAENAIEEPQGKMSRAGDATNTGFIFSFYPLCLCTEMQLSQRVLRAEEGLCRWQLHKVSSEAFGIRNVGESV